MLKFDTLQGDLPVQKERKRSQYRHKYTFREEVEILRNLHPERDLLSDEEMLDSSLRGWRREAEIALHIKEGQLGGLMKVALNVACLSKRCYLWALSIMEAYKAWKTKHQGNNKVNRMLFVQLPGLRDEEKIFHLLRQFRGGELSKNEFNSRLREEKTMGESFGISKKRVRKSDAGSLKKRIALLERRNTMLQREVMDLKQQLGRPKTAAGDVYTFQSTDEEDSSMSGDHTSIQSARETMPLRRNDEESNLSESEKDDDMNVEDSNESFSVLMPKMTYSRRLTIASPSKNNETEEREENSECHEEVLLDVFQEIQGENHIENIQQDTETTTKTGRWIEEVKDNPVEQGSLVLAKDDDEWFKATVMGIKEDRYRVHYFGYGAHFDKWLPKDDVKAYQFAVGEKVKAKWDDGFFYKAEVTSVGEKGVTVLFEDGITAQATSLKFC